MKLTISRRAARQLSEIGGYIARDNPRASERVIASILSAVRLLMTQPEMGRQVPSSRTREWPVRGLPYVLVYRAEMHRNEIVILAVFHGAQRR